MERMVFRRNDDPERYDFSEARLKFMDDTSLASFAHVDVVRAAEDEFVRECYRLVRRHNMSFDAAWQEVADERPRLFKLSRLGKVRDAADADVIAEDLAR